MARHDYTIPITLPVAPFQRASDRERPYAQRQMPGEHAIAQRDRRSRARRPTRNRPGASLAWYGEGRIAALDQGLGAFQERIREVCDDHGRSGVAPGHRG